MPSRRDSWCSCWRCAAARSRRQRRRGPEAEAPARRAARARRVPGRHAARARRRASTPAAFRTSPRSPATPPGSATPTPRTTPPPRPCRWSWTGSGRAAGTAPIVRDHPHSIFTALGRRGYRIVTSEEATAMCPRALLPERAHEAAGDHPQPEGRPRRALRRVSSARSAPSRRPTFWMKHALLPHGPWVYMPSGQRSRPEGPELLPGMQTIPGFYDDYLTRHNEQRYLLQLGFVDRLLGRLVGAAEEPGDVRRHADRGDRRPRLRVAGGRADAPQRESARTWTSSARCRCS